MRRRLPLFAAALVFVLTACGSGTAASPAATTAARVGQPLAEPGKRSLDAYRGLGAWVDVFDYLPAYQVNGGVPAVAPVNVDDMVRLGVQTLYLQAARDDERSPGDVVDVALLTDFVRRAHAVGVRVVAWYAPRFIDVAADLRRIRAIDAFRVDGHGFDGIALDIESLDNADVIARNAALVDLSAQVRKSVKGTLGAIVLPAVQTDVINLAYWPMFPWTQIAKDYDVWLPMAYATFRKAPYRDHVRYIDESVKLMRERLKDSNAPVHVIGGIADKMNATDFIAVHQAAIDTKALGWSVYDYATTPSDAWYWLRNGPEKVTK